jgi:predicted MFS family arabinose efflux permease
LAAASFVLATGETLYVTASQSVVPRIVSRAPDRLQRANSWLVSAQIVLRDFMGRPVGGALFGVVAWLPVLLNAVSAGLGALLIARIRGVAPRPRTDTNRRSLPREVADGMRWLWRHRVLRTLALATCVNNLAFAGWTVILVLLLQDRFDVSGLGFGAMTACLGVGGLVGSFGAPRLSRRIGMAAVLFAAMLGEGLATAVLGLAPVWPLAVAMLLTIGGCAIGWNVVSVSLRQSIVPDDLLGRVNSAYRFLAVAGAPIGAAVGGVLARWQGLSAPFLVGALLIVVAAVGIAAVVTPRAVEAAQSGAEHR